MIGLSPPWGGVNLAPGSSNFVMGEVSREIALTAVKKPQSPANPRSSPNKLVLGDQTLLRRYSMCY